MFCTRLRRRPSCADLLPTITTTPPGGLLLREREIKTHDLQIPLSTPNDSETRHLRVIVISSSCITGQNTPTTFKRLEHFASLTGAVDVAVVYHMNPTRKLLSADVPDDSTNPTGGVHGLMQLQKIFFEHDTLPHLPVIPLTAAIELPQLIKSFIRSYHKAVSMPKISTVMRPIDLLPLCIATPPMPQDTLFVVTDLFGNLRELAQAVITLSSPDNGSPHAGEALEKLNTMASLIGQDMAMSIVNFWREEWVDESCY